MSHNLECLCYAGQDSSGQPQTVYFAYIGGLTAEEIEVKANALRLEGKTEIRALSWDDYSAIDQAEQLKKHQVNQPKEIDAALFKERFNVLPPQRWHSSNETEIFCISEAISGNLHSFYVRLGSGDTAKHYEINAVLTTKNSEILGFCAAA